MLPPGYEIRHYTRDLEAQVLDCLSYHLGNHTQQNLAYFRWKYQENPYAERPLGIVALFRDRVVGFRGYFATRWAISGTSGSFVALSPGDTCVRPDHRRMGLSVAMGRRGMAEYESTYRVFLNTSAGANSVPGYQRMGFAPLAEKCEVLSFSRWELFWNTLLARAVSRSDPYARRRVEGRFGDVWVEPAPRPSQMASVACRARDGAPRIALVQDEVFYRWRFGNPNSRYLYYYLTQGADLVGFTVILVRADAVIGMVMDYGETIPGAVQSILRFVVRKGHFGILKAAGYSPLGGVLTDPRGLGFHLTQPPEVDRRPSPDTWPLLVRPVRRELQEGDWLLGGLDIRNIQNWEIKEIAYDGF
jgi:GNAT superfamily N-acetyltransferase